MTTFDIDMELEKIIEKYELDRHYPSYRISVQACAYIRSLVEELSSADTEVLFITMDDNVLRMIYGWAVGENVCVCKILSVEGLDKHIEAMQRADKVYIVAYSRTIEILHWLWRHDIRAESIYDVLEDQHIYCQMEFYRFFPPFTMSQELDLDDMLEKKNVDGVAQTLYEYYYQKQRLQYSISEENKKRIYEKLFFLAIHMRNFIEAERILETMEHQTEYEKCWREMEVLLDKIKRMLAQAREKHIIIYWMDSLSFEGAEKLGYLQEQRRHSLYFHNAFTVTPYTFPTFKSIFFGIRQVEDLGYRIPGKVEWDDSPLVQDIIKQGYAYKMISNGMNRWLKPKYMHDYYGRQILNAPCSEAFWSLIRQIIQDRQPTVYLVHALVELHTPCLSVRRDRYEQKYKARPEVWQAQFEELDGQLRFYDRMIGDSPYRIYMGDHGVGDSDINKLHVCFQIYHASWKNREVDKLFCYLDLPKVMHRLLAGKEIDDRAWDREYVPIQDVDIYSPNRLKKYYKCSSPILYSITAYKGVVTSEYIYAHFKTGDEIFHKWSDGETISLFVISNAQKDSALLEELRDKAGEFPQELDTDPKFEYAKNTYIIYEKVKRTVMEAVELLNEKIAGGRYADGSIILRPGGFHTLQLWAALSENSRKKIGGIIDRNPDCICKDLGYPIYQPEDKLPGNIKAVLLSTYENLEALKCETDKLYSDLEIMDIYQYWKDCGYTFSKNFYCGLEADMDIEFLKE